MFPPTRPRRFLTGATLALLLTAGAAGCGASGSSEGGIDTTTTTRANKTTTPASTTTTAEETTTTGDETTTTEPEVTTTTGGGVTTTTNGKPSSDPQDYVDALVASFETEGGPKFFEPGQAECLGKHFVDVVGIDKLQAAEISPDEFAKGDGSDFPPELGIDKAKANELYDQFAACEVDLGDVFTKVYTSEGNKVTAEQRACLDKLFTDENLRASFVADYLGEDFKNDPLDEAGACIGIEAPSTDTAVPTPSTVAPGN